MNTTIIYIGTVVVCAIIIVLYAISLFAENKNEKWEDILSPDTYYERHSFTEKKETKKKSKKEKFFAKAIDKMSKKNKWDDKMALIYSQAGMKGKGIHDFVSVTLKGLLLGVVVGILLYFLSKNILISLVIAFALAILNPMKVFSKRQSRSKDFKSDFAFFLKSLSFSLKNGSSLMSGFNDVVIKMPQGVLKAVMTEVLNAAKINGGNFYEAFAIIPTLVRSEEAGDFVETLKNNLDKGVPVANTLANQSAFIDRISKSNKMKKINNIDNLVLIPILLILFSTFILILAGISL